MRKHRINIWGEVDDSGMFAILKSGNELLSSIDEVFLQLINDTVDDLKADDYDSLMDFIDTVSIKELYNYSEIFKDDYRLSEVVRIQIERELIKN